MASGTIITLLTYTATEHPFTMEERKVNIVQRHTQELSVQDIPLSSHNTENTGNICITISILYYKKCIRIHTDTTILSSHSQVHSHILVLLTKMKDQHGCQRTSSASLSMPLEGWSVISKHSGKETHGHRKKHTNCIVVADR